MKWNINPRKVIKYAMLNDWDKLSLEITIENIYFIYLNNKAVYNTQWLAFAEQKFKELKNE